MLHIYIARHGQDLDNAAGILNGRRDKPLTQKGIEQAHDLALKIKQSGIVFDKIYTSPLKRASQTAKIILRSLGLAQLEILDGLIERDFGSITGKPQSKIPEICGDKVFKTPTILYFLSPPGAETFPQLLKRAKKFLKEFKGKHRSGNYLLITHGDFGKMLYGASYDLNWKTVLSAFHFGNSELLHLTADSLDSHAPVIRVRQHNI